MRIVAERSEAEVELVILILLVPVVDDWLFSGTSTSTFPSQMFIRNPEVHPEKTSKSTERAYMACRVEKGES